MILEEQYAFIILISGVNLWKLLNRNAAATFLLLFICSVLGKKRNESMYFNLSNGTLQYLINRTLNHTSLFSYFIGADGKFCSGKFSLFHYLFHLDPSTQYIIPARTQKLFFGGIQGVSGHQMPYIKI